MIESVVVGCRDRMSGQSMCMTCTILTSAHVASQLVRGGAEHVSAVSDGGR